MSLLRSVQFSSILLICLSAVEVSRERLPLVASDPSSTSAATTRRQETRTCEALRALTSRSFLPLGGVSHAADRCHEFCFATWPYSRFCREFTTSKTSVQAFNNNGCQTETMHFSNMFFSLDFGSIDAYTSDTVFLKRHAGCGLRRGVREKPLAASQEPSHASATRLKDRLENTALRLPGTVSKKRLSVCVGFFGETHAPTPELGKCALSRRLVSANAAMRSLVFPQRLLEPRGLFFCLLFCARRWCTSI